MVFYYGMRCLVGYTILGDRWHLQLSSHLQRKHSKIKEKIASTHTLGELQCSNARKILALRSVRVYMPSLGTRSLPRAVEKTKSWVYLLTLGLQGHVKKKMIRFWWAINIHKILDFGKINVYNYSFTACSFAFRDIKWDFNYFLTIQIFQMWNRICSKRERTKN